MKPDQIDNAQDQAEAILEAQLQNARDAARTMVKRVPEDPGFCDFCGEPTESPEHLFCGIQCSRSDDALQKQRQQQKR